MGAGKEIDHSDGSPYELKIVLDNPPGDDRERAADEVEKLEAVIKDLSKKHFDAATGEWNGIALKVCMSIYEDDLPMSKARLVTQWRLERLRSAMECSVALLTRWVPRSLTIQVRCRIFLTSLTRYGGHHAYMATTRSEKPLQ